jgi:hypothetical protein
MRGRATVSLDERGRAADVRARANRATRFLDAFGFFDLSQRLTFENLGVDDYPLVHNWAPLSIVIGAGTDHLALRVVAYSSGVSSRRWTGAGVRVWAAPAPGSERHAFVRQQYANGVLNARELLSRAPHQSTLASASICTASAMSSRRVSTASGTSGKDLEEITSTPFTRETLDEWGPFFDNAVPGELLD